MVSILLKKRILIFLLFISSYRVLGAPSVDGLFRNNNNPEVIYPVVDLLFRVSNQKFEKKKTFFNTEESKTNFLKIILRKNNEVKEVLMLLYSSEKLDDSSLVKSFYIEDLSFFLREKSEEESFQKVFIGALMSLAFNSSSEMLAIFNREKEQVQSNRVRIKTEIEEVINKHIVDLEMQKEEVDTNDKGEKLAEEEVLEGAPEEDIEQIEELPEELTLESALGERFYHQGELVKINYREKKVSWVVSIENIEAVFTREGLKLSSLSVNRVDENNRKTLSFLNYLSLNGVNIFPKKIVMESKNGLLHLEALTHRNHRGKKLDLNKIYLKAQAQISESKHLDEVLMEIQDFIFIK